MGPRALAGPRSFAVLLACVAAMVVTAGPAVAKPGCDRSTNPPGNSEIDQYSETVPDACGDERPGDEDPGTDRDANGGDGESGTGGAGGGDGGAGGGPLPPQTLEQLEELGGAGQGVARFAERTSPGESGGREGQGAGGGGAAVTGEDGGGSSDPGGGSLLSGVIDALAGDADGGMGVILPLILAVTAVGAAAYAARRRWRTGH